MPESLHSPRRISPTRVGRRTLFCCSVPCSVAFCPPSRSRWAALPAVHRRSLSLTRSIDRSPPAASSKPAPSSSRTSRSRLASPSGTTRPEPQPKNTSSKPKAPVSRYSTTTMTAGSTFTSSTAPPLTHLTAKPPRRMPRSSTTIMTAPSPMLPPRPESPTTAGDTASSSGTSTTMAGQTSTSPTTARSPLPQQPRRHPYRCRRESRSRPRRLVRRSHLRRLRRRWTA